MRVGLGIGVNRANRVNLGPTVSAIVGALPQVLRAGDTIGDITNIVTLRDTANYTAPGTIQTPEIRVNGTAQGNDFVLSVGEVVRVNVADDAGSAPYVRTITAAVLNNLNDVLTLGGDPITLGGEELTIGV